MSRPGLARRARTARDLAYVALCESTRSGEFATDTLDPLLARAGLSDADRRLATELVAGVIRRQGTLDALLQPLLQRPLVDIEDPLRWALRLGAYQIVLLSSIPPHAAVHETVETAKRCGHPRWAGFVNGVLRTLSRLTIDETQSTPSADAVPLASGIFRGLRSPLLPNPAGNAIGYFAAAFGFPAWLADRWAARFPIDELHRLGFWFSRPPPTCLRVNLLQTTRDEFLRRLHAAAIIARPGAAPESVWLMNDEEGVIEPSDDFPSSIPPALAKRGAGGGVPSDGQTAGSSEGDPTIRRSPATRRPRIESLPGYPEGHFSVQDESAMSAARLLAPQAGQTILDLCAAPGGKTTHLAELMGDRGRIVAADVAEDRLNRIVENCQRLQLRCITPQPIRRDVASIPAGLFDAALVDVPCSNTGVLGKRPEARWRLQPSDLLELAAMQRELLLAAMLRIRPGGRAVYSTCSIEPEENAGVVAAALSENPQWRLERDLHHTPGRPADGAYQALLVHVS